MFYDLTELTEKTTAAISEEETNFVNMKVLYNEIAAAADQLNELKNAIRDRTRVAMYKHLEETGETRIKCAGGSISLTQRKPKAILNEQLWMQAVMKDKSLSSLVTEKNLADMQVDALKKKLTEVQKDFIEFEEQEPTLRFS
jgi:peptidoglycan hydrolase CwlO-like protein